MMPLFKKSKEKKDSKESSPKLNVKEDKKESKRDFKLEKIKELSAKAYAVAAKRKWLAIILGLVLALYFAFSGGGLAKILPVIQNVKGFFN
jgi:hypothetical protein|tara:strand:+ start:585 stop:857 length:273 start_codon:yes stop_codon:yes gene_type:complete